jgi:diamine N-acetyltransferase
MRLRPAHPADIPGIVQLEHSPHAREFVGQWSAAEHRATMDEPDARYLAVEDQTEHAPHLPLAGFVILRGFTTEHRAVELKRIVLATTGRGQGRQILEQVMDKAFREYRAHKLWLDVFEHNARARHLYRSLGLREDGVLRDAVYRDGQFHSLILMSMLEAEYRPKRDTGLTGS